MTLTGIEIVGLVTGWYAVGVASVGFYELARNGFRYFQKQDVVRSFYYGVLGPIATGYGFYHLTVGRRFDHLRREVVQKIGFNARIWQNKEEHLRELLEKRYQDDRKDQCVEMSKPSSARANVQTIKTYMPPSPGGLMKKGTP